MAKARARSTEAIEAEPSEPQLLSFVGMQVRERRRFLGMTISDLSTASGISMSNLSKIETAHVSPSLASLESIATALGVSVSWLFQGYKDEGFLVQIPKGQGLITERPGKSGGHIYELLSNNTGQVQSLQPYLITLSEDGPQRASFSNRATEFVYVLSGAFTYRYGTRVLELSKGDALIFDGRTAHGPEEITEGPAQYLAVLIQQDNDTI
jgi:transcriptional regulator with XRE-family HTH domain